MEGNVPGNCHVCGQRVSFTQSDDGYFYCGNCNSQVDDIFDTGVDEEAVFDHYSSNRVRSTIPSIPIPALPISQVRYDEFMDNDDDVVEPTGPTDFGTKEFNYEDSYREIRSRYSMGIQIMIQMQCKVLVEDFKVSPLIVGLVGPIWLRYLASSKIMADDWAGDAVKESETQTQGGEEHSEPGDMTVNIHGKKLVDIWCKSLRSTIPISTSLAISFLVCHVARESVLPSDILKWVLEGKLPYFAAFSKIEKQKQIGSNSDSCPISASRMFRPVFPVSSQKLESTAAEIAGRIGLELPPVNFYAIASRFCSQLSIPAKEILPMACRICQWSMPSELYLPASESRIPTRACVMSIVIVAVRILFDINGYGIWESSLSHSQFSSYCIDENEEMLSPTHSNNTVRKGGDASSSPNDSDPQYSGSDGSPCKLNAVELLRILEAKYHELDDGLAYSSDLESYLKYCRDVVFSGLGSSFENFEEEKLVKELWDFYQKNNGNGKSDDKPTPSYQNGENSLCTSRNSDDSHHDDDTQPSADISIIKDRAIRRLKLDMEDNKFCYIPPRVKIKRKDYLHYARRRKDVYLYAVHADYYILLRLCAKVAQVETRMLHIAVLTLERRLQWLENKIDSTFDFELNLVDDVCDACEDESVRTEVDEGDHMEEL